MNIISKENIKHNSHQILRSLIQSSSEMNGCPITNILDKEIKSIWLSDESLPQEIILNINKSDFIYFPKKLSAIGIYCWHAYSTNPKLIEVLISTDDNNDNNKNNNINFMSLGDFDLALKPGMQLLHLDEDLLDNKLNDNYNQKIWIKLIIKETFGGKRTYINNLSLYEEIDVNALNLKSIQEENEEEENSSMVYLRESRIKNNFKKNRKNILGNNFNNNFNNNNGNILLTSEILISDSELSDRKIFNDKGDKFKGTNININMNNNSKSKIPEMSESKENNSSTKNNTVKFTKINNTNNLNVNNHKNSNNNNKDKSPLKSNVFNAFIISDKNLLYSDKKSFLNSNIFNGNNNNLNINTQTSQNNLNNQLLTTEMMKSQADYLQNDFFSPEKQNKFLCSKGEISNIEYVNDNNNVLLINEFHAYQKSQDEKMKKFDERLTNIENKINDINTSIKTINDNLTKLINDNKLNEAENQINKESIIKECEKLIKINLIDILDKKINPAIFNENKKVNNNNGENNLNFNTLNYSSNRIPESKFNQYEKNFYFHQTHSRYNKIINKNKNKIINRNTLDNSNKNISLEQNDNYMTHQLPFYNNYNNNNKKISSISSSNSNNNIIINHKRNSTFSHNYLNVNKNNFDENYNNFNNSQSKYNMSINNYSEFSESHIKDNKYNTIRTPYCDFKSGVSTSNAKFYKSNSNSNTRINISNNSNYNIPHKNKKYIDNIKGYMFKDSYRNYNGKENTVKLTKNKSNFSCLTYKNSHTISNSHGHNTPKVLTTKRKHSHANINNKEEIANKINNHLEEKFANFSDKIGKNINDCLLKPSIEKLKKNMKKRIKQVKNSLKKAEISQRSKRKESNS